MWGLSPSLDLLEEYSKVRELAGSGPFNILLVGGMDARHVLKTMAQRRRRPEEPEVTYHLLDLAMELSARQILLLIVALEPGHRLGVLEKARLWMEVYGNTLLRPSSARYLIHKAGQLVNLVTNREFLERRMPCLDLDLLRYKEKDHLENIFKYWKTSRVSIAKIWDQNLRRNLGTRYDAKLGVFDWDYNMKLADVKDGKRVCLGEYKHWRHTGIAFTWLETEVSVANPSLAVGIGVYGDQLFSRGYLGDMESGPFFSFGTECEETEMLESRGGRPLRRATDITERNLQRMFVELETGSLPTEPYSSDLDLGQVLISPPEVRLEDESPLDFQPERELEEYRALDVGGHKVTFLPASFLQTHLTKARYQGYFDMVYIAHNYFKFIDKDILKVLKFYCPVLVETRKFAISYWKKMEDFGEEVRKKMEELGGMEISKGSFTEDGHVVFVLNPAEGETKYVKDLDCVEGKEPAAKEERIDLAAEEVKEIELTNIEMTGSMEVNSEVEKPIKC